MTKTNTRKMVQGAMIASMFGALSLFNTYTGSILDIFICYVMIIPIIWYGYHYSLKDNIIVCMVSLFVIALVGLPFFTISALSSCIIGVCMAQALKKKAKKSTILGITFVASLVKNILIYQVFSGLLGIDMAGEIQEMYRTLVEISPAIENRVSLNMLLSLLPLVLIILSALEMYVIVMLCQIVLKRFRVEFPGQFHIALLRLDVKIGWILVVGLFVSYILSQYVTNIVINYIYILSLLAFGVEGFAFLCWLCIIKRKNKLMILVFIGAFIPIINSMVYVIIGILDIFSDLRKNILYNNRDNE